MTAAHHESSATGAGNSSAEGTKNGSDRVIVGSETAKGKQEVIPSSLSRRSLGQCRARRNPTGFNGF